jgi:hypothetical protein
MGAIGRGTTIHHIEVMNNVDDAFEWFGGTVNARNLIAWNCGDDGFDSDMGFRGKVQFGLVVKGVCKTGAVKESGLSHRGMEMDGGDGGDASLPFALSQWRNLTLVGLDSAGTGYAGDDEGIKMRDNARPQIYHSVVMDMGDYGVDIEKDGAIDSRDGWTTAWNAAPVAGAPANMYTAQAQGFQTEVADCVFFNCTTVDNAGVGILTDGTKQNTVAATSPIQNIARQAANGYVDGLQVVAALDPRPAGGARGVQKSLPDQGWFDTVDYYGAFASGDTWADGWSLISAMGVLAEASGGGDVSQDIDLVQGWNWVSFSVIPADNSLETMLASYGPQDGDEFKTAPNLGGSATYYGGVWYGIEGGIQPGVMYLLKKQAAGAAQISVTGPAATLESPINLVQGWNWIGFTGQSATPLATAMANYNASSATDGDELKTSTSLGGTATYYGGVWYGLGGGLEPGVGYKLKVQAASPAALVFSE